MRTATENGRMKNHVRKIQEKPGNPPFPSLVGRRLRIVRTKIDPTPRALKP